jgi:2-polyprenyl-3-methyl-5-hydroxy-6-metoxy-1,4-benzoquinol methylase
LTAAEANRRFFARFARTYNETEECVVDSRLQQQLTELLAAAVSALSPGARVLDACGGSGNASLALQALGVVPTTVDVSPEMLSLYEQAARLRGFEPRIEVAEIDDFLNADAREWDLVVFSSALHHLEDYEHTIELAAARLSAGGMLLTIFDPTRAGSLARRLRRAEYVAHVMVRSPRRVPSLVVRRMRRRRLGGTDDSSLGTEAELHALSGINDLALLELFGRLGLEVVVHQRRCEARFGVTRTMLRALRCPSSFSFLVRKGRPGDQPKAATREALVPVR